MSWTLLKSSLTFQTPFFSPEPKILTELFFADYRTCESSDHRCGNGLCVPASKRCDGYFDCRDESDEAGCTGVACMLQVTSFTSEHSNTSVIWTPRASLPSQLVWNISHASKDSWQMTFPPGPPRHSRPRSTMEWVDLGSFPAISYCFFLLSGIRR